MNHHTGTRNRRRRCGTWSTLACKAWLFVAAFVACAAARSQESTPGPAPAPEVAAATVPMNPPGIVLLPLNFKALQSMVGTLELVPEWTEATRAMLEQELRALVAARNDFQWVALPDMNAAERRQLEEHESLVRAIVSQAGLYQQRPWKARRSGFDRSVGDGLSFLHERAGAEYALLVDGQLVVPTGGASVVNFLMPGTVVPGSDTLQITLVRLGTGEVAWFNSITTVSDRGLLGRSFKDLRNQTVARAVLAKLLSTYPKIAALSR